MVIIIVRMKVADEDVERLSGAAIELATATRAEMGNLSYDCYQSVEDPRLLVTIERWLDQASLDVHRRQPHVLKYREQSAPLVLEKHVEIHETKAAE